MALEIYGPGDFIPDDGGNGRGYPIEDKEEPTEIMYDKRIQKVSYITANMVALFTEWFKSYFEGNYFRFIRIRTQSSFTEFKSFMTTIYKKEKPFLVIDPHPPEIVEDFIFAQNMLNRYNMIDPGHDNIGAKLLYSHPIIKTDLLELWYRPNRMRIEFDVLIMEGSTGRQQNTKNMLTMNIRHNSKFMLTRAVPFMIPQRYILNIANFHGMDWKSEEYLELLNKYSLYPIIRRVLANGKYQFYFQKTLNVYVDVPGFPTADSVETSQAIEWGARVNDEFVFSADLPMEFIFLTQKEYTAKFDRGIPDDPDAVTFISPICADMDWPKELGDYRLTNRLDIEVQEGDDPKLNILPLINDFDHEIFSEIQEWVDHGCNIDDVLRVRVYPNGSMIETGSVLHNDGTLELLSPEMNKLYTANLYVNVKRVNKIREGRAVQKAGTVVLDDLSDTEKIRKDEKEDLRYNGIETNRW